MFDETQCTNRIKINETKSYVWYQVSSCNAQWQKKLDQVVHGMGDDTCKTISM